MFGIFAIWILQVVDIQLIDHTDKLDTARIIYEPYDIPCWFLFFSGKQGKTEFLISTAVPNKFY